MRVDHHGVSGELISSGTVIVFRSDRGSSITITAPSISIYGADDDDCIAVYGRSESPRQPDSVHTLWQFDTWLFHPIARRKRRKRN